MTLLGCIYECSCHAAPAGNKGTALYQESCMADVDICLMLMPLCVVICCDLQMLGLSFWVTHVSWTCVIIVLSGAVIASASTSGSEEAAMRIPRKSASNGAETPRATSNLNRSKPALSAVKVCGSSTCSATQHWLDMSSQCSLLVAACCYVHHADRGIYVDRLWVRSIDSCSWKHPCIHKVLPIGRWQGHCTNGAKRFVTAWLPLVSSEIFWNTIK